MYVEERYYEDYKVGAGRVSLGRTITEADIVLHAGQTGDFYPHHMDAQWCSDNGFGQRVAHGTLILSVAAGMVADAVNPRAFSYGYDRVRFVRPVYLGDTIRVRTEITAKRDNAKRLDSGFVDELCTVEKQDGTVSLVFTHVYSVERRLQHGDPKPRPGQLLGEASKLE